MSKINISIILLGVFMSVAFLLTFMFGFQSSQLAITNGELGQTFSFLSTKLGIETYQAAKIVDAIDAGCTLYTIITLCIALTGAGLIGAGVYLGVKAVLKQCGKKAAIAY